MTNRKSHVIYQMMLFSTTLVTPNYPILNPFSHLLSGWR